MYTTGTISYNTLPISKKSNIWFSIWTRKKLLHRLPNSTGGRPLNSLSKEVDFIGHIWITNFKLKTKTKKKQRMQDKNMNHSARSVVCLRCHIFNRLKKGVKIYTLLIWIGYKCNVLESHTTMRHTAHVRNSSSQFKQFCANYDNTITLITREKLLHM